MKNNHWTERSIKDFRFRIVADFIAQLEKKIESLSITQSDLAERLGVTKGRVSQLFNKPGNVTLNNIVKYSRALEMKVSIVAYEDDDPDNKRGPINAEVFQVCWEQAGKPQDFWDLQKISEGIVATAYSGSALILEYDIEHEIPIIVSASTVNPQDVLVASTTYIFREDMLSEADVKKRAIIN